MEALGKLCYAHCLWPPSSNEYLVTRFHVGVTIACSLPHEPCPGSGVGGGGGGGGGGGVGAGGAGGGGAGGEGGGKGVGCKALHH